MQRRTFLGGLGVTAASLQVQIPAAAAKADRLRIRDIEIFRVEGRREAVAGANQQRQVNPIHIYDEHRPAAYREKAGERTLRPVSAFYLRVRTEEGIEGLYGPIDKEAAIVIDRQLRGFLKGKDPLAGEALWDRMYRSNRHSRGGHFLMAISAVDNTLWDLRAGYFDAPVYRLLGGPTRANVEAYASCLGFSLEPDRIQERAAGFKRDGFRHQKWFIAYGPGDGAAGMKKNVEMVRLLREAVGDDVELMFDAFSGWDLTYAIAWSKQVERYRPRWIEEAVHPEKIESFVELRRRTTIPVASGEHFYGRWEVHDYLRAGALDVVQADPEWCGGISELVRIAAVASLHDVPVIPHGHSLHTALHVVAGQPPMTCPLVEYLVAKMEGYHHFEKAPPVVSKGRIPLPQGPGFGIELDPAKVEKQTVITWS